MTDITKLKEILGNSFDIQYREIEGNTTSVTIVYLEGFVDKTLLARDIILPISKLLDTLSPTLDDIAGVLSSPSTINRYTDIYEVAKQISVGMVAIEGKGEWLTTEIKKVASRSVEEPPTSTAIKGPREGFVEDMRVNVSLLRKRLKTPALRLDKYTVGKYTNTDIVVAYIDGIVDKRIVDRVSEAIEGIDIDGIMDSSYITAYIEEKSKSLFRQIGTSEKPDILVSRLLEGRVGIIVDGSPIVLTVPYLFLEDIQDSDDYFKPEYRTSFERILRGLGVMIAVLLPGAYVALQEFQYQFIPLKFLITLLNATSGIPLTPTLETMVVLLLFEILNETSMRMPKYVGMALSVVGAVVLGETAVRAGILGSPAVLVGAVSGIGLYSVPDDAGTYSVLRLLLVMICGVTGLYGLVLSSIAVLAYLSRINSYGTPYLAPYSPMILDDMKDGLLMEGIRAISKRPRSIPNTNTYRSGDRDE